MTEDIKQRILDTLDDSITSFLYYDRKEDSRLSVGVIEYAIQNGDISISELVECFKKRMYEI